MERKEIIPANRIGEDSVEKCAIGLGKTLRRCIAETADPPVIATSGIGMVGYYSTLRTIDIVGLTDRRLAHSPERNTTRPGHSLRATIGYLRERDVMFARTPLKTPPAFHKQTQVVFGPKTGSKPWYLVYYDHARMTGFKGRCPDIHFTDYTKVVDQYITTLGRRDPKIVKRDLEWLRPFYFDHNPATSQYEKIRDFLRKRRGP